MFSVQSSGLSIGFCAISHKPGILRFPYSESEQTSLDAKLNGVSTDIPQYGEGAV